MSEIQIVTKDNRSFFYRELLEMHRQRKAVFIEECGWPLACEEGLEIDEYDHLEPVYLLYMQNGKLRASARMLPTNQSHLMGDHFEVLCPGGVPKGAFIWECTRFCPHPDTKGSIARPRLLGTLIAGMMEAAVHHKIRKISFVASSALAPVAMRAGWQIEQLAQPVLMGEDYVSAWLADVTLDGLERVRKRYRLQPLVAPLKSNKIAA